MINTRPDGGDVRLLLLSMKQWYTKFCGYTLLLVLMYVIITIIMVPFCASKCIYVLKNTLL